MHASNLSILSTRPLSQDVIDEAKAAKISLDCLSFIETESILSGALLGIINEVLKKEATVVFTSMNAVEAVNEAKQGIPKWKIYCTGGKTKELVEDYFGKESVVATAFSAGGLAEVISRSKAGKVIFFCGNRRREELPVLLKEKGILVKEIEVYKTTPVYHDINNHYKGILFFSPSAVEAFFERNRPEPGAILFAIGKSTANTIKKHCLNKIVMTEKPDKAKLAREAIFYFSNKPGSSV